MSEPSVFSVETVGELLFIGIDGVALTTQTRSLLERVRPGGIILFKRNVKDLTGLAGFCDEIRAAVAPPPLLAIDEEGGRVTRIAPHVEGLPPACATAGIDPVRLRGYWRRYGDLLSALGIDIDFAPVVDLCPPDAANGIADRSFGADAERAIACARQVIAGLLEAGVLPALKHFPGLGSTLLDSHHHLPAIRKSREAFEREDLAPFLALAGEAPSVMIGHGHYPFYSGADPVAATLSREVSTGLLRERVGFAGAAISDDLEMKAVSARIPWEDLAPRAIEAGCDMVLVCHSAERILAAHEALRRRAGSDRSFFGRCREAAARVAGLRDAAAEARSRASLPPGSSGRDRIEPARSLLAQTVFALRDGAA